MTKKSWIMLPLVFGSAFLNAENAKTSASPLTATIQKEQNKLKNNMLLRRSTLQYQAPEFDKIKDSDFRPAFDFGLAEQLVQVEKIANSKQEPTFENTVLALELTGENLTRAQSVFYNLLSANSNDTLQKLDEEYAPIFAAHSDKIYLNGKLYARVKAVYDKRNSLGLDAESIRLVEYYNQIFSIAGASLSEEKKKELKQVNEELAVLSSQFSSRLLVARKNAALLVDNVQELDGLNADEMAALAEDARAAGYDGKYLIAIKNTTQQPLLAKLKNRAVRERLFNASWTRAEKNDEGDTQSIVKRLAVLRLKKAQLLGKKNFAEWKLQNQMAKNPESAKELLSKLAVPAVGKARQEVAAIQQIIDEQGGGFQLQPWDWYFYSEQVRKQKYDLNEEEIMPYFEVRTVLEKGVFYAAEKLYGISFKPRTDLPVYHPDVVAYEVFDSDGKSLAIYYLDFYTRDKKKGGAWMNNFVDQSHYLGQKPVVVNVFNYQKPATGKPSLISFDDVSTMFHEFGHSIHGFFADQKYASLSGTAVSRDFVEFPSQINEHWALEPSVLKNYAVRYDTGQPIPEALVDKLKKSATFNSGYALTELLAAATLDMSWHTVENADDIHSVLEFEKTALHKYGLDLPQVPTRYHTPYFAHIWGGGYSAGYYAYIWSEVLDLDAFKWISANGGLTRENGDRFRKYILSVGNSIDLNTAFQNFTGHAPSIEPLLVGRGLK